METVGAEAHLRLGSAYLRLARPEEALEEFRQVESSTSDPFLIYLTRYFRGRTLEAAGDGPAAIQAYRGALQAVPRAESAAFALAALLFTRDARDEAFALVESVLSTRPPAPDPWRLYGVGDFRFWPTLIARLREGLMTKGGAR